MKIVIVIILLVFISHCQEWYMPDSHLISDKEFVDKVTNDRTCFKFVKYFTPQCPYCRYLKAVFDTLKHQKQWCFQIFQLNCQWYPQFCRDNVRAPSFPYTVIYDQNGNLFEEIHGFYPENIIGAIFARIEDECLKIKNGGSVTQQTQNQNPQSSLSSQTHIEPIQYKEPAAQQTNQEVKPEAQPSTAHQQVQPQPSTVHQQLQAQPQTQNNQPQAQNQANIQQPEQQKQVNPQSPQQELSNPHHQQPVRQAQQTISQDTKSLQQKQSAPSYISYIFYGVCIVVAAFYVRSLHKTEQPHTQSSPQQPQSPGKKVKQPKVSGTEVEQKSDQDSELLDIPDDQL